MRPDIEHGCEKLCRSLITFGGRVRVTRSEQRALLTWFRDVDVKHLPRMATKHGGRYLVINGGRT